MYFGGAVLLKHISVHRQLDDKRNVIVVCRFIASERAAFFTF
jgi:hypothetical protein